MSADTKSSAEIIEQIAELSGRDVHEVTNHYEELKKNTAAANISTRDVWLQRMNSIRTPETAPMIDYLVERLDAGDIQTVLAIMKSMMELGKAAESAAAPDTDCVAITEAAGSKPVRRMRQR